MLNFVDLAGSEKVSSNQIQLDEPLRLATSLKELLKQFIFGLTFKFRSEANMFVPKEAIN